jgi:hypothetical protein
MYLFSYKGGAAANDFVRGDTPNVERQSGVVDPPAPRRLSGAAPAAPRPPPSVNLLRASIEDVGRQLSKLTRATGNAIILSYLILLFSYLI